jgi:hypothetical protein
MLLGLLLGLLLLGLCKGGEGGYGGLWKWPPWIGAPRLRALGPHHQPPTSNL